MPGQIDSLKILCDDGLKFIENIKFLPLPLLFLLVFCSINSYSADYEGTILPPKDAPFFIKKQWEKIFEHSWVSLVERDYKKVGMPDGLEEQVWKAWAPGAKPMWHNISPGYTNVIYDLKVDGGVVTLLLDGGGLVQSEDGGETWRSISHHHTTISGCGFFSFDISPADPDIIAVGGSHIDYTLNGGHSWRPVYDKVLPPFKLKKRNRKKGSYFVNENAREGAVAYGAIRFNADGSRVFSSHGAMGHGFGPRKGLEPEMNSWLNRKIIYVGNENISNFSAIDLGAFAGVRCILPHFSNPNLVYASFSDGTIYVCRNAKDSNPIFVELTRPEGMNDFQAIDLDVSPENPDQLLITLIEQTSVQNNFVGKAKLMLGEVRGHKLFGKEIEFGFKNSTKVPLGSARWDPHNSKKVFLGMRWGEGGTVYVSDDAMKTFKPVPFPKRLYHAEPGSPSKTFTGYANPYKFGFDRKKALAVVYSATGAWVSHNDFKTIEDLVITYDSKTKFYGNKGVGFAECGESVAIRDKNTYLATTDHGAWRSNGKDTSKWLRISSNPGMPEDLDGDPFRGRAVPMFVSDDEDYIYLIAWVDYMKGHGHYDGAHYRLMLSRDQGGSWVDVTDRLGLGTNSPGGKMEKIYTILFDRLNAQNQWVLLQNTMLISANGGKKFKKVNLSKMNIRLGRYPLTYDSTHKILYAITADNGGPPTNSIVRSEDMGRTWNELPFKPQICFYCIGVLDNGDLVLSDDGRLLVVPFKQIESGLIDSSMVRMTIGDNVPDIACGLRTFRPIICRGRDIVTFPQDAGWHERSSANRVIGPLLSRDGGETFQWIVYDFPHSVSLGLDIRKDIIIIGGNGIHKLDMDNQSNIRNHIGMKNVTF